MKQSSESRVRATTTGGSDAQLQTSKNRMRRSAMLARANRCEKMLKQFDVEVGCMLHDLREGSNTIGIHQMHINRRRTRRTIGL